MPEAVRLVIWDLDETFWRGTVTEGGIREYVEEHHNIVIELAKRGILSSICSKNDESTILPILKEKGILEYFVFPSISWEPKGPRLAQLVEQVQLRPSTIMFIDDNPSNRAEAASTVPELQIESEQFIATLLSDPRFKGKDDSALTRLAQYKLLESRHKDQISTSGSNEEFLRNCDIRVSIEYDVELHLDRAIELINRTNQLNFTKRRLPEDITAARDELLKDVRDHFRQSGLVRVRDKYGDYGFVGFFMVRNGTLDEDNGRLTQSLQHYCFSCRTLGMMVECWLYDRLQRPRIRVVGEVLTDLMIPRTIDWITEVASFDDIGRTHEPLAEEIRVHGGCEANAVGHYLGSYSPRVLVTGNFHSGPTFVRFNSASLLLSACDRRSREFELEADTLGIPYSMLISEFFAPAPPGTVFVFGGQQDVTGSRRYRHRIHRWEFSLDPHGLSNVDLVTTPPEEIGRILATLKLDGAAKETLASFAAHLRANYEVVRFGAEQELPALMRELFSRIPVGSRLILITDHDRVRLGDGTLISAPWVTKYNAHVRDLAATFPYVSVVCFGDHIFSEDEIHVGGNHYDRMVYCRLAEEIVERAKSIPAKAP